MGSFITLKASDGHRFQAYKAGPDDAKVGLVIVQEIFGVNQHIRNVCDRYAADGFAVLAPALFDRAEPGVELGYTQDDIPKGMSFKNQVPDETALVDIEACAAALKGKNLGIIGYCWGGTLAWLGAARSRSFKAAVGWYGGGIAAAATEKPGCPVQLHFGGEDKGIPMTDVEKVRAAQPDVDIFVYPNAGHGFGCDERGSYSEPDAKLARERSVAFFRKHLG